MGKLPLILLCVGAALLALEVAAQTAAPTENGLWYYRIGGAEPVSLPPSTRNQRVNLSGSAELRLGYSCAAFDPVVAVTNSLNDIGSGADSMMDAMTTAATSAIAALPALILQRANPGLYDLFQNALLKAEHRLDVATKSCEAMEAEIANGQNPYADLVTLSKGNDWKLQMGTGGVDVISAKQSVEVSNGDNGIPWFEGRAGGQNQPPLRLTGDLVEAGYEVTVGAAPTAAPDTSERLTILFSDADAARSWVTDVVGESVVTTCGGCAKDTLPGYGLLPKQHAAKAEIQPILAAVVSGQTVADRQTLEQLSAPGIAITRQLIDAINELPSTERSLIVGRLTAEIATARTVERALVGRRLLLTGRQVPEVIAAEPARAHADHVIAELDREIESLLFDTRVRQELVSRTALTLLERAAARRHRALQLPAVPVVDPTPLNQGGVSSVNP